MQLPLLSVQADLSMLLSVGSTSSSGVSFPAERIVC